MIESCCRWPLKVLTQQQETLIAAAINHELHTKSAETSRGKYPPLAVSQCRIGDREDTRAQPSHSKSMRLLPFAWSTHLRSRCAQVGEQKN